MKILFVTYDVPYPLDSGGKIRAYHLIRQLAKKNEVTLLCFSRDNLETSSPEALKKITSSIHVVKRRSVYSFQNALYLPRYPFPVALYYDPEIYRIITSLHKRYTFDAMHLESFYTSVYQTELPLIPTIVATENIEWSVYEQFTTTQPFLIRSVLRFEIARIKRYEEQSWTKATACIAVSEENKRVIQRFNKHCAVVQNGIDCDYFADVSRKRSNKTLTALFVGNFRYLQNKDAVSWLLTSIWPRIRERMKIEWSKDVQLVLVGSGSETQVDTHTSESVTVLGHVADIRKAYQNADIFLAPIRIGSGTKFKVLEASASGISVVTTPKGAEGLTELTARNVLTISRNEDDFVNSVCKLLNDDTRRSQLGTKAREIVFKYYSWDSLGETLRDFYETLVDRYH